MFSKIYSTHFPSWRRYTFLSHLTTKSKISVRWIKKLVAVTGGVYIFIHKLLPEHSYNYFVYTIVCARIVTGRHTLCRKEQRCPPAHFCVYGICIITNNAVSVKYIHHHSFIISRTHLRSVRSPKRNGALR